MAIKKDLTQPFTEARLKPYMTLSLVPGGYDGTKSFADVDILNIPLVEVGTIEKFNYKNDRVGGGFYRTFNRQTPGVIQETYPGLPTYGLILDTVILYKQTLFEVMEWSAADVGAQDKPQIIQLQLYAPGDLPQRTWTFRNCWFNNNPWDLEANPTSEMVMRQTLNVDTAGVIEGKSSAEAV